MLVVYNTFTKQKEVFTPLYAGKVGMYSCGPTVYGNIHIGNIRAYLFADTVRRTFEYFGYEVRAIKNITDVGHLTADDSGQGDSGEDKMTRQAHKEKKTPQAIAAFYEKYFHETERTMNILPAHYFPRATAHVSHMIKLIEELIAKKFAYAKNGNVFFDVTTFPTYGKLSGNTLEHLKVGARLEEHPDKNNPWDFALWLKAPENHLMKWSSPWSIGYPGWHIECSAMSMEYLGESFDIHTGGEDNIFPHHEAEIAQSEGVTGKPFVKYWLHNRHVLADGVKMSKSKGNFSLLEDILERGYAAMEFRFFALSSHYRSQMNFTWDGMNQAKVNLATLQNVRDRLLHAAPESRIESGTTSFALRTYREDFDAAIEDDFNTPLSLTVLLNLAKTANKLLDAKSLDNPHDVLQFLDTACLSVLGLKWSEKEVLPEYVRQLSQAREEARKQKDFTKADELREKIEQEGFALEDTSSGGKVRKK
jgi:cysteinyl-tRNA synthetase